MNPHSFSDWVSTRLADQHGVWPWAEHNQGLLSASALIVAFLIAFYEMRRAAGVENRSVTQYVDWVLNCADRSIELTVDALRTIDEPVAAIDRMPLPLWRFLNGNARSTLEEIQPLRPTHPELAHHVNRLLRCMAMEVKGDDGTPEARKGLDHVLAYVRIARDHVARYRPRTAREKIAEIGIGFSRRLSPTPKG